MTGTACAVGGLEPQEQRVASAGPGTTLNHLAAAVPEQRVATFMKKRLDPFLSRHRKRRVRGVLRLIADDIVHVRRAAERDV